MPAVDAAPPALDVRESRALGSRLRLVTRATPGREAGGALLDAAWAAVLAEFGAVDDAMSRFREDSEITRLNRAGGRAPRVSRRLRVALVTTERARRRTGGRFDPRVLRAMDRLGFAGVGIEWTQGASLEGRVVECSGAGVRISAPVDLGGIGKGLALRWGAGAAGRLLGDRGLLLDAGGDIVARGPEPWSIGIEDPLGGEEPLATCELRGGLAIATSSTRVWRRDAPGGPVHHLVDPRTGLPGGAGLLAVTVAWPDPAWAEVWSKTLFLAGAAAVAAEARGRGLAAWWVDVDGRLSMTPAARGVTTWVRDEARARGPVSPP